MSTDTSIDTDTTEPDNNSLSAIAMRILLLFRRSFLFSLGTIGALMILAGAILDGVLAGMFGIWGTTFAGISVAAYAVLTVSRRTV